MRLGKRERQLRKQQWDQYREVKAQVISSNLADQHNQPKPFNIRDVMPTRSGERGSSTLSGNLAYLKGSTHKGFRISFSKSREPLPGGSSKDFSVHSGGSKMRKPKSILSDADLYTQRPVTRGGSKAECMVRTGTTPARKLVTVDKHTGDRVFMRIGAKPVFKPVGLPGSVPEGHK